ncbi:hypothetical protein [Streptomyces griseorubiginosus]|uniref:hypothetical protein n=1 Tax=Streptomyces griseorubiginosus TaxID=67304 RepID=UPI001C64118D|nr:hypothetical protein [Streptomyces griseorubiginosus]
MAPSTVPSSAHCARSAQRHLQVAILRSGDAPEELGYRSGDFSQLLVFIALRGVIDFVVSLSLVVEFGKASTTSIVNSRLGGRISLADGHVEIVHTYSSLLPGYHEQPQQCLARRGLARAIGAMKAVMPESRR